MAMTNSVQSQKHSLECLRLESDCKQLAGSARNPDLQSHFVRMSQVWSDLAEQGLAEHVPMDRLAARRVA